MHGQWPRDTHQLRRADQADLGAARFRGLRAARQARWLLCCRGPPRSPAPAGLVCQRTLPQRWLMACAKLLIGHLRSRRAAKRRTARVGACSWQADNQLFGPQRDGQAGRYRAQTLQAPITGRSSTDGSAPPYPIL